MECYTFIYGVVSATIYLCLKYCKSSQKDKEYKEGEFKPEFFDYYAEEIELF